jgi:hypothetical protein
MKTGSYQSIAAVVLVAAAASSVQAQTKQAQTVEGVKPSLALLDSVMKNHAGSFCMAKQSTLRHERDDKGGLVTRMIDERKVPESDVWKTAQSLSTNRSLHVGYCQGMGKYFSSTVVGIVHAVRGEEVFWTAQVVKTGETPEGWLAETLAEQSRRQNAKLPRMMDDALRLDSASTEGETFILKYTYVDDPASAFAVAEFRVRMKAELVSRTCKNDKLRIPLANGARTEFRYHGKHGKEIATITVDGSDCK